MAKDLSIRIVGDASSFNRSVDQASGKVNKLSSKFGAMAKGGAIGAAVGGVALLGKTLFDSVGAAKEAEQAQSRLESALKTAGVSYVKHGAAIQQAIDKTSKLAALDDEDLSDAFAKLVRSTGSVTKATEGMALAADIAAARGISLEAATKTVEKGLLGNEAAFRKVGVEIAKGTSATAAFEAAQAQFAGAAKAHGDTAAGAQAKLGVAFENLQEKIGEKLLPVLAKLAVKLTEAVTWAETNWPKFQKAAEPVFKAVKLVIDNVIDRIKAIVETIQGVITVIQGIRDGDWSKVWAGIKQIVIDGFLGMAKAMLALPAKILEVAGKEAWKGLSKIGGWIVDAIVSGLTGAAQKIKDAVADAISGALGRVQDLIDLVKSALSFLSDLASAGAKEGTGNTSRFGGAGNAGKRAAGGPVTAGMPYVVGERGPELFVPGRSGSIVANGGGGRMGGGGVIELHSHVYLDGRQIFEAVQKHATRNMRAGGSGVPGIASL